MSPEGSGPRRPAPAERELVVVTGGGTGMGRAIAVDQAARGADVVIVGRREGPLAATAALAAPGRVRPVVADVSTVAGARAVAEAVAGKTVTGVVTAAGGQGAFRSPGTELEQVHQAWQDALALNLTTAVLTVEALAPRLAEQRGRVVLVSSTAALDGQGGPYATAKAAVNGYGRDLARRLGRCGITVNVLAPGFVADTEFFTAADLRQDDQVHEWARAATLVGRLGTSADIAAAAAWLLSAEGGFVTGQVISPNGGTAFVR